MPHLTFKIFVAWVELALLIWERYSEINLLIEYHQEGHIWWFGLTAAFLSAPGVLTILLLTYNYKKRLEGLCAFMPTCLPCYSNQRGKVDGNDSREDSSRSVLSHCTAALVSNHKLWACKDKLKVTSAFLFNRMAYLAIAAVIKGDDCPVWMASVML